MWLIPHPTGCPCRTVLQFDPVNHFRSAIPWETEGWWGEGRGRGSCRAGACGEPKVGWAASGGPGPWARPGEGVRRPHPPGVSPMSAAGTPLPSLLLRPRTGSVQGGLGRAGPPSTALRFPAPQPRPPASPETPLSLLLSSTLDSLFLPFYLLQLMRVPLPFSV